jgi:hypothetical protein
MGWDGRKPHRGASLDYIWFICGSCVNVGELRVTFICVSNEDCHWIKSPFFDMLKRLANFASFMYSLKVTPTVCYLALHAIVAYPKERYC